MIDETEYRRLARYFAGEDDPEERAATEAWLKASPDAQAMAEQLHAVWRASKEPSWTPSVDDAWSRVATRLHVGDAQPQTPLSLVPSNNPATRRSGKRFAWPGASSTRATIPLLAAAAIVAVAITLLVVERDRIDWPDAMRTARAVKTEPTVREFRTARGQRAVVAIGDDSRVELGAESVLRVSDADSTGRRLLELEGQAAFDIVHDTLRTVEVRAGNAITEDLGTRFTVRAYRGESRVQVFVVSGSVALRAVGSPAGSGTVLGPRDFGALDTLGRTIVRNNVDSTSHLAWTRGQFIYDNALLGDVLRDVSRWFDVSITVADTANLSRRITIYVPARSLPDVIGAITTPLRLRPESSGRRIVLQ